MAHGQLESSFGYPAEHTPRDIAFSQHVGDLLANEGVAARTGKFAEPDKIDLSIPIYGDEQPFMPDHRQLAFNPDHLQSADPQTPEERLRALLNGLTENPSPESLARAEGPIVDAIREQMDATTRAKEEFQSFDGVADLIDPEPSYNKVLDLFSSQLQADRPFIQNMDLLPHYVFSGQPEKAAETLIKLLDGQTPERREALNSYFETLNRLAKENPGIAKEYSTLFQTYQDASAAEERMVRDLDNSPAGVFILNK